MAFLDTQQCSKITTCVNSDRCHECIRYFKLFKPDLYQKAGTIYVEGNGQKLHGKSVERVIVNKGADRHCTGTAQK